MTRFQNFEAFNESDSQKSYMIVLTIEYNSSSNLSNVVYETFSGNWYYLGKTTWGLTYINKDTTLNSIAEASSKSAELANEYKISNIEGILSNHWGILSLDSHLSLEFIDTGITDIGFTEKKDIIKLLNPESPRCNKEVLEELFPGIIHRTRGIRSASEYGM